MKIHLVDGTYELFRAFYGAPGRAGADGQEVGATRALVGALLALVEKEGATHVAVAFDHVIESFRNELFPGYKTGEGIDPDLYAQFGLAEDATRALGFVCWPMVEVEADDALATAAARWAEAPGVEEVRLCSPDKDLMQCVRDDRVVVWDRRRGRVHDRAAVLEKMGVVPEAIPDYLALVGDAADGIPGLPRWGAKSAAAVLGRFRRLEAIPDDPAAWADLKVRGRAGLAESLAARREDALLYRRLATLVTNAPLEEDLADLEWRGARRDRMAELAARLDDDRLIARIPRWRGE
jgi:5'-3' exonuclease